MASAVPSDAGVERSDGEKLGEEITGFCGYVYAADEEPEPGCRSRVR